MIIVTGAAGFIGANTVKALNARGERDILAVDNLASAGKFSNLADCDVGDYLDKREFLDLIRRRALPRADLVFHQGACSDTMQTDGSYMMENNYRFSVEMFRWCQDTRHPLLSSRGGVRPGPRLWRSAGVRSRSTSTVIPSFVRRFCASIPKPALGTRDRIALLQRVRAA